MVIPAEVAKIFVKLDPTYKNFVRDDGKLYVKLIKSIYGLRNSAFNFYTLLKDTLAVIGYYPLRPSIDSCVFTKVMDPDITHDKIWKSIIGTHVDDLGCATNTDELLRIKAHLEISFGGTVKFQTGDKFIWLGLTCTRDRIEKSITLSQEVYIVNALQDKFNPHRLPVKNTTTPARSNLFEFDKSTPSGELDIPFLSKIMSLAFLANMTRPDILTALSALSTRVNCTNNSDYDKLDRIWRYVYSTKHLNIVLKPESLVIHGISDASYAGNSDRKSQSGIILSLGFDGTSNNVTGNVYSSSKKQKTVVTSACEAEVVAQAECLKYVMWLRYLMEELGHGSATSIIHQDNMSAIEMGTVGHGNFSKSKHIDIKFFFISDHLKEKIVSLRYVPTKLMVSDILTKPLQGLLMRNLRNNMLNHHEKLTYVNVVNFTHEHKFYDDVVEL